MLIYGKEVREKMQTIIKEKLKQRTACLAVVQIGNDAASLSYVNAIRKFAREVDAGFKYVQLDSDISQKEAVKTISDLNNDPNVQGIMIQTPLPSHLDKDVIINSIDPKKDVEGIHSFNLGQIVLRRPGIRPCTPKAVISILKAHNVELTGKKVAMVGASPIVGAPLALMLLAEKATVTVCNSKTKDLAAETLQADIVIAAVGKINLITPDMVREHSIVIDVGTNFNAEGKMCGDVDPQVKDKAYMLSAVPGGVGMITVAELFDNLTAL